MTTDFNPRVTGRLQFAIGVHVFRLRTPWGSLYFRRPWWTLAPGFALRWFLYYRWVNI
jgi:hypothetical protein